MHLHISSYSLLFYTGARLHQFRISAMAQYPKYVTPTVNNTRTCYISNETIGPGEYKTFDCDILARYVVIQRVKHSAYLTLCEVEVFAGR